MNTSYPSRVFTCVGGDSRGLSATRRVKRLAMRRRVVGRRQRKLEEMSRYISGSTQMSGGGRVYKTKVTFSPTEMTPQHMLM